MNSAQKRKLILILGAIAALGPLSIDMYLPSFPSIADDLGVDTSSVSLTLTAYFIGISVGQLLYGPLVDRYGRKPPLLFGLALYTIAAIACTLSQSLVQLIGFRLLLALGGSVGMVSARAMVRDLFDTREVARVFSSLILVMGVAPILAPGLGGIFDSLFGWRLIFVFLALTGCGLWLVTFFKLKESKQPDASLSLNLGLVIKRYIQVLYNKQFVIYGLAGSLAMAGLFTYIASSPLVLMESMGFQSGAYTILFGVNASLFIIGSQVNRQVLKKFKTSSVSKVLALAALILCILFIAYGQIVSYPPYLTSAFFGLFLFCFGFINPNTTALSLEPFDEMAGVASALVGSFRMAAGAIASAIVSTFTPSNIQPVFWLMGGMAFLICALILFYKPPHAVGTQP